jgi:formate hydrogenlyase transcriptional activator
VEIGNLLGAISAIIQEVIGHDNASISLYDPETGDLAEHFLGPKDAGQFPGETRLSLQDSISGLVFRTREPVRLERLSDASFATAASLARLGMQSGFWVPLVHNGRAIGTLSVVSRLEGGISQHVADELVRIAAQVAMVVSSAVVLRRLSDLRDRLDQERQFIEDEINLKDRYEDIVGENRGFRQVLKQIDAAAPSTTAVLIQGEAGTGKERLARAIHRLGPRRNRNFIKLNCAAIPAGLVESELFGHEKGAFTGAIARKIGRLELAHEGTLFLEEVGDLPLDLQPKLLRAIQEHEFERMGGNRSISFDVRLIAAANFDLTQMVAEKRFRADLFDRLNVFPIFSPPLRDRAGEIPFLVRHFVDAHSRRLGKTIETIPDEAMKALVRWQWPGNIRELEIFMERAVMLTRGSALYVPLAELETEAKLASGSENSET